MSARCFGVKKKSFNEKHQFYSFYAKIKAPYVENHEIYKFCLLSLQMQYTKGEDDIGTVAFEMKLLMNDERETIDDDGCRLVAIGHLGDSGDL